MLFNLLVKDIENICLAPPPKMSITFNRRLSRKSQKLILNFPCILNIKI